MKNIGLERFLVTFEQGQIIFFEHDTEDVAYMVKQGKIKLIKIINGVEKFVATIEDGDFLGEMAIMANNPRTATAITVEKTQAYKISKANFELLMNSNPSMAIKLLTLSAQRIERQRRQLQILLLNDDEAQVLDAILMLYERLETTHRENVTINITPYELTTWAGVVMDKAKRILASYQENRRISVFPDRVVVQKMQDLERVVLARRKVLGAKEGSAS
jgi:CRP/FNR family transcriptional regulator, cyclic AMP receptor protein